MSLPTTYAEIHDGAIVMPQTAAERRRVASAQAIADRLSNRCSKRGMHPEYEARMLEEKWGVNRETCVLVCSLLKGAKHDLAV